MKPAPTRPCGLFLSESAKSSQLPRYDYDEIIDALEGEEDDAADSDAGEDYELVG